MRSRNQEDAEDPQGAVLRYLDRANQILLDDTKFYTRREKLAAIEEALGPEDGDDPSEWEEEWEEYDPQEWEDAIENPARARLTPSSSSGYWRA